MANSKIRVDLLSDTQTRPTEPMRAAMMRAEVGDEQHGEDPSTNRLCEMVADMLGKEAALFLPSGVMCNQIAILVHCRPGDEILADESAHILGSEAAGAAVLAGAMVRPLQGVHGVYDGAQLEQAVRPAKRNAPRTRLAVIEQTSNRGGGTIWTPAAMESVAGAARRHGLSVHMDGARIMNAAVASGVPARVYAAYCDSAWLDLSKGLGCPVGGVLAGSAQFIDQAWVWKHRLGGAMRQSGILAAAGIYALNHHVDRLAEDHENARLFARGIAAIPGVAVDPDAVQTNLVFFDLRGTGRSAVEVSAHLQQQGIRIGQEGEHTMRAVTHLDVDRAGIEEAVAALRAMLG